jgi:hypothetical protein
MAGSYALLVAGRGSELPSLASTIEAVNYGTCSTILPDPPALVGDENWDTVSTVDVTMTSGVPLTDSDSNVLNGTNAAMVGNEIIQYATVTPLGGNSYRLSRLLRGRRGTDFYMTGHIAAESFVMLQTGFVRHQVCDESLRGKTVLLKAVTSGGSLGAVSPTSLLITGNEWKCYSPTYVKGTRNGGNDLTVTWIARTRSGGEMVDGGDVNDADAPDTFDVEFLASPGGAVVRTVSGLTSATTLYTAAQQTADGLTPGNPVSLVVYQIGRYLRGWPENATV